MPPENWRGAIVDAGAGNLDTLQPIQRALADLPVMPVSAVHQPLADIAAGRDIHAQAITRVLVNDAPGRAHQPAALLLRHGIDVERLAGAAKQHRAGIGPVDPGETAQQRRFARAGFADNAQHLARPEIEGDIGAADALAIKAADTGDREQGGGVERGLWRRHVQGHDWYVLSVLASRATAIRGDGTCCRPWVASSALPPRNDEADSTSPLVAASPSMAPRWPSARRLSQ